MFINIFLEKDKVDTEDISFVLDQFSKSEVSNEPSYIFLKFLRDKYIAGIYPVKIQRIEELIQSYNFNSLIKYNLDFDYRSVVNLE